MLRRTFLRKPLLAALALLMAAAPSVAQAGNLYGTKRTSRLQFKNYAGTTLTQVRIGHTYGIYNDEYGAKSVAVGATAALGNANFYTGGVLSADDYWTVSAQFVDAGGNSLVLFRVLDSFQLHAIDAGVPVTIIITQGDYNTATGTRFKLNFYSNNGSQTDLPLYCFAGAGN